MPNARVTVQVNEHGTVLIVIPGHEQVELPHHMAHAVKVEKALTGPSAERTPRRQFHSSCWPADPVSANSRICSGASRLQRLIQHAGHPMV